MTIERRVEWVERSETHRLLARKMMGFARALPILRTAHYTPALADHGGALLVRHIERLRHTFPGSRRSTAFIAIDPR
jgi:hypothetical protein